jgi:peptide deformylase
MVKLIIRYIVELKKPCLFKAEPEDLKSIIQDLEDTLKTTNGIGLSANQIGYKKRVSIIRLPLLKLNLINPSITDKKDRIMFKEGCLSFNGIELLTDRYNYIKIINNDQTAEFTGLEAIVIQHEIDHLNGLTIFDRKHKKR